jgi:hypothetical protein
MKTTIKQSAGCAAGKYHSFSLGVCWHCGMTLRAHKAHKKTIDSQNAKLRYRQKIK